MPDIITIVDLQGHESLPIVGTLIYDRTLGDYVEGAGERYYLRPTHIIRQRPLATPALLSAPAEEQPAEEPGEAPQPEQPAWEIDPADPYAHLSAQTRRMLEERDRRQAEQAPPAKRKRGRPRKHAG